ncbi:MAG: ribosome silencing factor [Clostridia bacterium]|nr:ribosome silencing factor [Clostridia bacterium]
MEEFKITDLSAASPREIADKIIDILDRKDAKGIKLLHVEEETIIADYFIICNGATVTQLRSFAGEIEFRMGQCSLPPVRIEGYEEASWIVLDFSSVIVHIFNRDTRNFYNLEKLWAASKEVDISAQLTEK